MKWRLRPIRGNSKSRESYTKEELIARVRRLLVRIEKLEAEVVKVRTNSSNSSKPPSSDIVNVYFRFITTPGVEPTNDLAEQAIRFVVIDRRITQGTPKSDCLKVRPFYAAFRRRRAAALRLRAMRYA